MRFLGRESEQRHHTHARRVASSWDTFDQTTTELSGPLLSFTRDHSWGASPIRAKTYGHVLGAMSRVQHT